MMELRVLKHEGNKLTVQLPLDETSTGLRNILTAFQNQSGASVNCKVQNIFIDCSDNGENHITVNYTRQIDSADQTVIGKPETTSYKLTDVPSIVEYEIDEQGQEIEGSRVVIREQNNHLTDWDSAIGDLIEQGCQRQIKTEENGM